MYFSSMKVPELQYLWPRLHERSSSRQTEGPELEKFLHAEMSSHLLQSHHHKANVIKKLSWLFVCHENSFFRDIRRLGKGLINERNCWDLLLDFVLPELVEIGQRQKLLHFSLRLKVALKDKVAPKIVFCDPLSNDQKLINMPKG